MTALVGHTGFVGSNLLRQAEFEATFNSRNIAEIDGRRFDLVVCAAAPATMWAANNDPEGDLGKIRLLLENLGKAKIERLVLISTIAVLDDASAGYNETTARYETGKAYGRNRRLLEESVGEVAERSHVIRLPALFGEGLKKNFVFDILNPVPTFVRPEKFESLLASMPDENAALVRRYFFFDDAVAMMQFARPTAAAAEATATIGAAFAAAGFTSRSFTNSDSRFQYYGLDRLWADIERCIALDIDILNMASEPLTAADVFRALTGDEFCNAAPPVYREDMHSRHAGAWDASTPYLYTAADTLASLTSFAATQRAC